jgi:hypothetical protein
MRYGKQVFIDALNIYKKSMHLKMESATSHLIPAKSKKSVSQSISIQNPKKVILTKVLLCFCMSSIIITILSLINDIFNE